MNKVIVYTRYARHADRSIMVFPFSEENVKKVKKLCQDDWGGAAHQVGYKGDYGFGHNEEYFSYYRILEVSQI